MEFFLINSRQESKERLNNEYDQTVLITVHKKTVILIKLATASFICLFISSSLLTLP